MIWHENIFATHFENQPVAMKPYIWPGDLFLGCALPDKKALGKNVVILFNEKEVTALCVDDSEYVFGLARPRAEIYKGKPCPLNRLSQGHPSIPDGKGGWIKIHSSNGAGIDITPGTARALGLLKNENVYVDWVFEDNLA